MILCLLAIKDNFEPSVIFAATEEKKLYLRNDQYLEYERISGQAKLRGKAVINEAKTGLDLREVLVHDNQPSDTAEWFRGDYDPYETGDFSGLTEIYVDSEAENEFETEYGESKRQAFTILTIAG